MIKAGYKTSEFWFTVVSFIFSGLYLIGILKENDQKEQLISIVSHAVESILLISGQLFILYRYIKGRTDIKKIVEAEELEKIKHIPKTKVSTPKKPRKPRSTTSKKVKKNDNS